MIEYLDNFVTNHNMLTYVTSLAFLYIEAADIPSVVMRSKRFGQLKEHGEKDLSEHAWMEASFGSTGRYLYPKNTFIKFTNCLPLSYVCNKMMERWLKKKNFGDANAYEVMKAIHRESDSIFEYITLNTVPGASEMMIKQ